jgi:replication initiator protein
MANPRGRPPRVRELIDLALEIEQEAASPNNGHIGYMARSLTLATMPHRKQEGAFFERSNGLFTLTMLSPPVVGLPYGVKPRLVAAWLTTEAVRTRTRELVLGDSLSHFMRQLDLVPSGGRWGTITMLKEQLKRLFSSSVSCVWDDPARFSVKNVQLVDEANLWWTPKVPAQAALFNSTVTLSEGFFREIIEHPVPIDMRAIRALKQSSMELDIYFWLTHRLSYLRKTTRPIPWGAIKLQFGADYQDNDQGLRDFKKNFIKHLRAVNTVYPVHIEADAPGLVLHPSPTSVRRLV